MLRSIICVSLILLSGFNIKAQQKWCGTPDRMSEGPTIKSYSDYRKVQDPVIIPVVIHLFYFSPSGNIPDSQLTDGLRVINEDFNKRNADTINTSSVFKAFSADIGIEFQLAKLDANGDRTSGILRYDTLVIPHPEPTSSNFNNVKYISAWPPDKYYNIWLVQSISGGTLGYAQYPGTEFTYGGPWETWGVIIKSNQWGTIGTSVADGRTATHEIGHSFGCYHTFLSQTAGCGSACDTTGDEVCDTPPADPSYDCTTKNTCTNDTMGPSVYPADTIDQIENFMSYNSCQSMFSEGQKARMWMFINMFDTIQNLFSTQNLIETGIIPPAAQTTEIEPLPKLRLRPNPFRREVDFSLEQDLTGLLRITDLLGRTVHRHEFYKHSSWIPFGNPGGIYIYTLETETLIFSGKLIYLE